MRAAELNTWRPWRTRARRVLEELAASRREFTADDLIKIVGPPIASSKNALGPLFAGAARDGLIERVGYRPSERASRRAGVLSVWRGTGHG